MFDAIASLFPVVRGIFYIAVFFGGSIFVHELGHFLAAKKRGLKVDRFSIGFGPKIFSWKGRSETEYRISLLPLGGYVSIPQLADMEMIEGAATSDNAEATKRLSYLDKVIVFAAGAFFNVLFALLCAVILWIAKTPTTAGLEEPTVGYVQEMLEITPGTRVRSPAAQAGILPGDQILEIDGAPVSSFKDIAMKIALGQGRTPDGTPSALLKIRRGNEEFLREVEPVLVSYNPRSGDFVRTLGVEPTFPLVITDEGGRMTLPAGFEKGDRIVAVELPDGAGVRRVFSLNDFADALARSRGEPTRIVVERGVPAEEIFVPLTPKFVPVRRALGKISFTENGVARELRFVPVPDDIEDFSETSPRRNLVVLDALPEDSPAAENCPVGAKLVGISDGAAGIFRVSCAEDFARVPATPSRALTLLLDLPSGGSATVSLENAVASVESEEKKLRAGLPIARPIEYVREAPWTKIADAVKLTYDSVVALLNPKSDIGVGHLNGVFSIADTYYEISFDLRRVLALTVLINVNLAFLNLLPIPVLDGGHILFATIERLRRRPLSRNVLGKIQTTFVFVLLAFMAFILFRDFSRTRGNADLRERQIISAQQYFR